MSENPNQVTPLFDLHQGQGAKFTSFAGWQMPLQYTGIIAEHQTVRSSVGAFDVSHMAKWQISGAGSAILQTLVPSDLARVQCQQAVYTLLLNEMGGIIDDVVLYRHADGWWMVSNAATYPKVKSWLGDHLGDYLIDLTYEQVLIALQGRAAIATFQSLVQAMTDFDLNQLSNLGKFQHCTAQIAGSSALIARTGYTGEDGLEVSLPAEAGRSLWQALLDGGVPPCGLGCRDTLRLEAGLHLYGQDMDETTSPISAGLGWTVDFGKGDFIGRSSLLAQGEPSQKLVGLTLTGRHIARHDYPIQAHGETIGKITSGTFSPTLNLPIALGYVSQSFAQIGQELDVLIRDQPHRAIVTKRRFYQPSA
jgi:aminomethyltransferase